MTLEQEVVKWKNMVKLYKFDVLTGMKQRRDFEIETIHKMTNQEFWLSMVDVTGLHKVNREKGYTYGDKLIKRVADEIRMSDGLWECYRLGGDEFMSVYFDEPDLNITCATESHVYSRDFEYLSDMIEAVDKLVIEKKALLNRRRED